MPFSDRRPQFNLSGTLTAGVSAVATTISSDAFTDLPTNYSGEVYLPLVIADDSAGTSEIVYVTNHATSSSAVTIARAREGTKARAWNAGSVVRCAPTVADVQRIAGYLRLTTSSLIPLSAAVAPLDIANNTILIGGMTAASNGLVVPVDGYYEVRVNGYCSGTRAFGAFYSANKNGGANRLVDVRVTKSVSNSFDVQGYGAQMAYLNAGDRVNMNHVLVWYDAQAGNINSLGSTSLPCTSLEVIKL